MNKLSGGMPACGNTTGGPECDEAQWYGPRRSTALALASLLVVAGCQQPNGHFVDRQLIGEVMMRSELSANLRALCMPSGRLSGSPNGAKAEQFVADKLREYGLANVHFEPFTMSTWQDRRTTVTLLDDPPRVLAGALSLGNCLSTPAQGITAELVDAGQGTEEDIEAVADKLPGRFAFVREGGLHRSKKMALALAHGAAGLIQVSSLEDRARVGQCHPEPRPEPGMVITGQHGAELAERLEGGLTVRLNVKVEADAWQATPNNVVGEIPGHGPLANEIVILCAHLDSWHLAEGALDNGTGASAILETARALTEVGWKPARTVRCVWFMGEEHGLRGSKAYVQQHLDELDDVVVVVNVDMPGEPRRLTTFQHPEIIDFLQAYRADLAAFEIAEEVRVAEWTASDHAPFMKQGVCAVSLHGDLGPGVQFFHSTGDTYDQVDRRGTNQTAAALAVLVRRLADAPTRPTVRLEPTEDEEDDGGECG